MKGERGWKKGEKEEVKEGGMERREGGWGRGGKGGGEYEGREEWIENLKPKCVPQFNVY